MKPPDRAALDRVRQALTDARAQALHSAAALAAALDAARELAALLEAMEKEPPPAGLLEAMKEGRPPTDADRAEASAYFNGLKESTYAAGLADFQPSADVARTLDAADLDTLAPPPRAPDAPRPEARAASDIPPPDAADLAGMLQGDHLRGSRGARIVEQAKAAAHGLEAAAGWMHAAKGNAPETSTP